METYSVSHSISSVPQAAPPSGVGGTCDSAPGRHTVHDGAVAMPWTRARLRGIRRGGDGFAASDGHMLRSATACESGDPTQTALFRTSCKWGGEICARKGTSFGRSGHKAENDHGYHS